MAPNSIRSPTWPIFQNSHKNFVTPETCPDFIIPHPTRNTRSFAKSFATDSLPIIFIFPQHTKGRRHTHTMGTLVEFLPEASGIRGFTFIAHQSPVALSTNTRIIGGGNGRASRGLSEIITRRSYASLCLVHVIILNTNLGSSLL